MRTDSGKSKKQFMDYRYFDARIRNRTEAKSGIGQAEFQITCLTSSHKLEMEIGPNSSWK